MIPCLTWLVGVYCSVFSLTDPSASQTSSEERLNHEAQELEKRLSMLSHRSTGRQYFTCQTCGQTTVVSAVKSAPRPMASVHVTLIHTMIRDLAMQGSFLGTECCSESISLTSVYMSNTAITPLIFPQCGVLYKYSSHWTLPHFVTWQLQIWMLSGFYVIDQHFEVGENITQLSNYLQIKIWKCWVRMYSFL